MSANRRFKTGRDGCFDGLLKSIGRRFLVDSVSVASFLGEITIVESVVQRAFRRCSCPCAVRMPDPEKATCILHLRFLAPDNVYSRHTLISAEEVRKCQTKSGSKHLQTAET
jgi:hypothetical protein